MNIIHLPPVLPGELDVPAINQKLHTGEVTLDWSSVEEAPQEAIAELLAGLDLVEHNELLGIATVPDQLSESILQVLTASTMPLHPAQHQSSDTGDGVPDIWKPAPEEQNVQEQVLTVNEKAQKYVATRLSSGQTPRTILQPPSTTALRDELERLVLQDLLGPAGGAEEEVDETNVRDRYLVGLLAPRDQQMAPEEMDELAIPEEGSMEDGSNDDTALQVASLCPSAIGMSFCVHGDATMLRVTPRWGYYKRQHSETLKTPKGSAKTIWKRQPMGGEPRDIPLQIGAIAPWSPAESEQPDVVVRGLVRRTDHTWTVTLFLVNEQREPEKRRDEAWVFQPELTVEAPEGSLIFQPRPTVQRRWQSDEEQTMVMLYRRHVSFAIGHNVGVHAEVVQDDPTRAIRLSTRVVPSYDVPRTEAPTPQEISGLAHLMLDMKALAQCPATGLASALLPLVNAYSDWITAQQARLSRQDTDLAMYTQVAEQSLAECENTLVRMREGITLLAHNRHAAQAFAFMNRAMWQQRIHTLSAENAAVGKYLR